MDNVWTDKQWVGWLESLTDKPTKTIVITPVAFDRIKSELRKKGAVI